MSDSQHYSVVSEKGTISIHPDDCMNLNLYIGSVVYIVRAGPGHARIMNKEQFAAENPGTGKFGIDSPDADYQRCLFAHLAREVEMEPDGNLAISCVPGIEFEGEVTMVSSESGIDVWDQNSYYEHRLEVLNVR